jgi:hypothetical protein
MIAAIAIKFFLKLLIVCVVSANYIDQKFIVNCGFSNVKTKLPQHNCHVALFAQKSFNFSGTVVVTESFLCNTLDTSLFGDQVSSLALFVRRGECSFVEKAKVAQRIGFGLLVIANSESEGFPAGPIEANSIVNIPVIMSGKKLWDEFASVSLEQLMVDQIEINREITTMDGGVSDYHGDILLNMPRAHINYGRLF